MIKMKQKMNMFICICAHGHTGLVLSELRHYQPSLLQSLRRRTYIKIKTCGKSPTAGDIDISVRVKTSTLYIDVGDHVNRHSANDSSETNLQDKRNGFNGPIYDVYSRLVYYVPQFSFHSEPYTKSLTPHSKST